MAITGVLDLQRRSMSLGEIRIGESVPGNNGGRTPRRRKTFLFTTPVEETAVAIAAHPKIGGTVTRWDRRDGYWAVDTPVAVIEVWVPPRGLAVDAWMEAWDGGRCLRRCDGITEQRSGQPCKCPQPDDPTDPADVARKAAERKRLAGLKPPQGCKPTTRIHVQIPGLPGITGVWTLRTGSANAAVETADSGDVLERARSMDVYLPALLVIHWRPGQDGHPYPVPVLRLRPSAEQVAQLPRGMDGMLAMLGNGNGPLALTAGTPPGRASKPAPATPPAATAAPKVTAQRIADDAANATTREEIETYAAQADEHGLRDEHITTPGDDDGTVEELRDYLAARWQELPAAGAPPPRRQRPTPGHQEETQDGDGSLFDDPDWADRAEAGR